MTVPGVKARRKTLTTRSVDTWSTLKRGDRLAIIAKGKDLFPREVKVTVLVRYEDGSGNVILTDDATMQGRMSSKGEVPKREDPPN